MTRAVIRRAGDHDVALLAGLRRQPTAEQQGGPIEDDTFEQRFCDWWSRESERRIIWLAQIDDVPVGMLNLAEFLRMPRPGTPPSRWGYVANVFVVEAHRNQGIGGRLIAAAVAHARTHNYARVVLSPSEHSVPLSRRAGFGPADMLLVLPLNAPHLPGAAG